MKQSKSTIFISSITQEMEVVVNDSVLKNYKISTGKNGLGEKKDSECTPRGWHKIHSVLGLENEVNSVFVTREWTGEIYSPELAAQFPGRDWILTRILRLEGLEPGKNKGADVDTFDRFIYIHGTPDATQLGKPGSRGCIRMNNMDIIELANWVTPDTLVYIK
ncbi:MAG: L,D-transpeptidase [Legionella sp.]|jgi:lipoprotein-anchoring transpeptidase ErfK/SrfK